VAPGSDQNHQEFAMLGEIIAIGDELTSGRIANTTSAFAARQLFLAGHEIYAMHTIGDTPKLIGEALKRAINRVDFVIVTGGLGSTTDDLTNEAVADALDRPATLNKALLEKIRSQLQENGTELGGLEKLAWLPEGAEVLNADERMAGYMLVHQSTPIFFLPGVPSQATKLLVDYVLPIISSWSDNSSNHVQMRLYKTVGLPEYAINKRLQPLEKKNHLSLGYYPVENEVHISLTVTAPDGDKSGKLFVSADQFIRKALGQHIYGTDRETLPQVVGELLKKNNLTLGVAESCTGGLIGAQITKVAGSSEWFVGGVIAYSNHLKELLLNVDHQLLVNHGAVSSEVAKAMAAGLAERTESRIAISVTGIAGPGGGSREKPVGTVHIGLYINGRPTESLHNFSGSREEIQAKTAQTALNTLRLSLLS